MSDKLEYARWKIADLLGQAEKIFIKEEGMKLTFIARHPTLEDRYLILTSDEYKDLANLFARVAAQGDTGD